MHLPRSSQALDRADYGLAWLAELQSDDVRFRFLVPYVLDLVLAVSRLIDKESRPLGHTEFREWWLSVDRADAITQLRHAELKRQESRTGRIIDVTVTSSVPVAGSLSGVLRSADGREGAVTNVSRDRMSGPDQRDRSQVTVEWIFKGDELDGRPVLDTLAAHLQHLRCETLPEAERRLSS